MGPTVPRPVQDSLAVKLLDNRLYILGSDVEMHVSVTDVSVADTSHYIGAKLFSHNKNTLVKLKTNIKVELFF